MNSTGAIILGACLFIIMFGMGLSLTIADFKRVAKRPKAILIGLINQIILLPLIAYTLLILFDARPEIAVGFMILAACPGGTTSNLLTHLAKGDTALSVSLTAFSSLITIISIPLIIQFGLDTFLNSNQRVDVDEVKIIGQLLIIVIIPIGLGMLIKSKKERFADQMEKPVKIASGALLFLVIVGLLIKERATIPMHFVEAGTLILSLLFLSSAVGYLTAKIFNLGLKESISISIESGIQNGTLAIAIATGVLNSTEFAIAPSLYGVLMYLPGLFFILMRSRLSTKQ